MDTSHLDPKTQKLIALFEEAAKDPAKSRQLQADPLAALKALGIEVDPGEEAVVAAGLSSHLLATTTGDHVPSQMAPGRAPKSLERHVHVNVRLWGVVVRLDHEAVNELPKGREGIETLGSAIGAVMAASSALGPVALVIFGAATLWGAVLTAYLFVLPALDQGKGVYLTITWPQIAAAVASGGLLGAAMMPIPTTVV